MAQAVQKDRITEQFALEKTVRDEYGITQKLTIHVPQLECDSPDAEYINDELAAMYAAEFRQYEDSPEIEPQQDEWCPETYINWDAYWYGDCVSLVMFRYDGGSDPGYSRGWCFDFATEKQVSVTEMLQRMGLDPDAVQQQMLREAMQTFDRGMAQGGYYEGLRSGGNLASMRMNTLENNQLDDLCLLLPEPDRLVLRGKYCSETDWGWQQLDVEIPLTSAAPADTPVLTDTYDGVQVQLKGTQATITLSHGYGKAGKGDDIVIEACEFSETFLKLTPYLSVVLNIDNDHLDYYGSMGELKFAFKRFALMTQFMIFANADDKNTMDVMYTLDRRVRTFGINNDGDYQAVNVQEYKPGFFEFDLKEWSKVTGHIRLAVPGRHNIYNALAMCAVCRFAGLTVEQCAAAAASFKGAGRRFEVYGECNGAVVVDDYAHHPTELRATLTTAKELGYKRLIAVHQPFTYSRTKMLFNDFVDVLKIPDIAVITPIMGSREPNDPSITSAKLAAQIPGSVLVDSLEAAADWVKQNAREGDLVITLGCGDIYKASKMMVADNK